MDHGEVEGVDPAEIICIEHVLRPDASRSWGSEIGLEHLQHRLEHRRARNADATAGRLKPLAEGAVDERVKNDPRLFLERRNHAVELGRGTHHGMNMLDRPHLRILRRRGAGDRDECLARGVGDEMKMEVAAPHERSPGQGVDKCG
jgi:hypothetical protein